MLAVCLVSVGARGAIAASHYLITSTNEIKPSVLKALRGAQGPAGRTGPKGATGASGATGLTGPMGAAGPAGIATLTYVSGSFESNADSVSPVETLSCPSGTYGVGVSVENATIETTDSSDISSSGFEVYTDNESSFAGETVVYGVCASGPGLTTSYGAQADELSADRVSPSQFAALHASAVAE